MESNLSNKSKPPTFKHLLLLIFFILAQHWISIQALQETKGGGFISVNSNFASSVKGGGGGGSSSFRESIESFKRQQQVQVQPVVQTTNIVKESISSFSSSRPVTLGQQQQQQVLIEQQEQQNSIGQSEPASYGGVAGTPGVDFPDYVSIPNTKFSCDGLPHNPGMYADESTGCQVYHLCYQGRRESFLCGIGTVFNQAIMNCDFWHSVDCSKSSQYYQLNADFGKSLGEPAPFQLQPATIGGSSSSKVDTRIQKSNFVQATLPALQPTSSSFSRQQQQQSSVRRTNQASLPTLINTIQSNSASDFSSARLSSTQLQQPLQISLGSFSQGKTSLVRDEQSTRNLLLSPSRRQQQQQLNQFNQLDENSAGQFPSESSTQFEVMSMQNAKGSAVSVGSSLVVADAVEPAQQATLEKSSSSVSAPPANAKKVPSKISSVIMGGSSEDSAGWKPYFKSKTSSAGTKSAAATVAPPKATTTTPTTTTTTSTPTAPTEAATVSRPDQEPVFSNKADEKQVTGSSSSSESTAPPAIGSVASIEPDVGPAVAPTETPSIPTPTPAAAADQAQSEPPVKLVPPPPTEGSANDAKTPATTSEPTTATTAAVAATTAPAGTNEQTTFAPKESEAATIVTTTTTTSTTTTTTTAAPTTIKQDNTNSSVEYAADRNETAPNSGDNSAEAGETKRSKKRK